MKFSKSYLVHSVIIDFGCLFCKKSYPINDPDFYVESNQKYGEWFHRVVFDEKCTNCDMRHHVEL